MTPEQRFLAFIGVASIGITFTIGFFIGWYLRIFLT